MSEHESALALQISELFQTVCDQRDLVDKDLQKLRKEVVLKELQRALPKLEILLKKEIGIDINITNSDGCQDILIAIDMDKNGLGTLDRYIDNRFYNNKNIKIRTAQELQKISSNIQGDVISFKEVDDTIARCFQFSLSADFSGFLCAYSEINNNINDYSAKEIAALVLHEVGHVISCCKRLGNYKYSYELQKEQYKFFTKNATYEEKIKALKSTVATMKKTNKNKEATLVLDNLTKEMIDRLDKDGYDLGNTTGLNSILSLLGMLFVFLLMFMFFLSPLGLFYLSILTLIANSMNTIMNTIMKSDYSKIDDRMFTHRDYTIIEREADEFVSKHGYGVHLATALLKIKKIPFSGDRTNSTSKLLYYNSLFISFIGRSFLSPALCHMFPTYEIEYKRLEDIQIKTIKYLKNSSNSKEMNIAYIESIEKMDKYIKETNSDYFLHKIMYKIYSLINNITPTELFNGVIYGTLSKDMNDLIIELDKLQNNRLYVSAAKLDIL